MSNKSLVGKLVLDRGKLGLIGNEIKSAVWLEDNSIDWDVFYEIKYVDGNVCIISEPSLLRHIEAGKILLVEK